MESYNLLGNTHAQHLLVKNNMQKIYSNDTDLGKQKLTKSEETAFNDLIQKGEISDSLASGYGPASTALTFAKTGKEIKAIIPGALSTLEAQKAVLESKMADLIQTIGFVGTEQARGRYAKNIAVFRYAWKLCEPAYENGSYAETTEENKNCSAYNSLVYMYCDICDDIDSLKVIGANVEDNKKYTLSVSQLIALNFTNGSIQKAEDENDIEKGGEGSKGGKVIGHTKSGKAVYADKDASHEDYKDFSDKDHIDAANHHFTKMQKAYKGHNAKMGAFGERTEKSDHHEKMAQSHLNTDPEKKALHDKTQAAIEQRKKEEDAKTIIGKTRSGKDIHDKFEHEGHKDFDSKDHHDAALAHSKANNKGGISDADFDHHWNEGGKHVLASKEKK